MRVQGAPLLFLGLNFIVFVSCDTRAAAIVFGGTLSCAEITSEGVGLVFELDLGAVGDGSCKCIDGFCFGLGILD